MSDTIQPPPPTTVGQLLDKLAKYPRDMRVVVDGYEGGHDDPWVYEIELKLHVRKYGDMLGVHGDEISLFDEDEAEDKTFTRVLAISRNESE